MKKHIKKHKLVCKCSAKGQLQFFDKVEQVLKPYIKVFGKLTPILESEFGFYQHAFKIIYA